MLLGISSAVLTSSRGSLSSCCCSSVTVISCFTKRATYCRLGGAACSAVQHNKHATDMGYHPIVAVLICWDSTPAVYCCRTSELPKQTEHQNHVMKVPCAQPTLQTGLFSSCSTASWTAGHMDLVCASCIRCITCRDKCSISTTRPSNVPHTAVSCLLCL